MLIQGVGLMVAAFLVAACSAVPKGSPAGPTEARTAEQADRQSSDRKPEAPAEVAPVATAAGATRADAGTKPTAAGGEPDPVDAILASAPTRETGPAASPSPSEPLSGSVALDFVENEPDKQWRFRIIWSQGQKRRGEGSFHLVVSHSYSVPMLAVTGGRKWKKVHDGHGNDLEAALAGADARCTFYHCTVTEVLDVQLEQDRIRTVMVEGLPITLESDRGERKSVSLPALVGPPMPARDQEARPEAVVESPRIGPADPAGPSSPR